MDPILNQKAAALLKELARSLRRDRNGVDVKRARRFFKRRIARGDTALISLLAALSASRVSAAAKETEDVAALPVANSLDDLLAVGEMCIPGLSYGVEPAGEDHADHYASASAYAGHEGHGAAHHGGRFASRLADKYRRDHEEHERHANHDANDDAAHGGQHASHNSGTDATHQGHADHQGHASHDAAHAGGDHGAHAGEEHEEHDVTAHAAHQSHEDHQSHGAGAHEGHGNAHASHDGAHQQHAAAEQGVHEQVGAERDETAGNDHHRAHAGSDFSAGLNAGASEQKTAVAHADHGLEDSDNDDIGEDALTALAGLETETLEDTSAREEAAHTHHGHHYDEAALAMMDAAPAEDLAALSQPII